MITAVGTSIFDPDPKCKFGIKSRWDKSHVKRVDKKRFSKLEIRIIYSLLFELFTYNQQCLELNEDLQEKKKLLKVLLLWSQQKKLQIFCLFCQSGQLTKNMI
ncbi:hypothetical protein TNCV_2285311 [Trichonephila clavipes]|nr:hypothetical protein TNCV_2285311 [Trichonephila clavipes]